MTYIGTNHLVPCKGFTGILQGIPQSSFTRLSSRDGLKGINEREVK